MCKLHMKKFHAWIWPVGLGWVWLYELLPGTVMYCLSNAWHWTDNTIIPSQFDHDMLGGNWDISFNKICTKFKRIISQLILNAKVRVIYRVRQKSNPLAKIRYLWICSKFFCQINSAYRGGFRPHILQISLQYLIAFQNYNYLNLNVHFSNWTSH